MRGKSPGIDWRQVKLDIWARWKRPRFMVKELGMSHATVNRLRQGDSVSALTLLRVCKAMESDPLKYLIHEQTATR